MGFTVRVKLSTAVAPRLSVTVKTTFAEPQWFTSGRKVRLRVVDPEKVATTLSCGSTVLSETVHVRERWAGDVSWSETVNAPTLAWRFSQVETVWFGTEMNG